MNIFNKIIYSALCLTRNKKSLTIINKIASIDDYNMIIPNLYLGNIKAANDIDFLKKYNILAIVNCTENDNFSNYFKDKLKFRLCIKDSKDANNMNKFQNDIIDSINFIEESLNNNKPVFVHCYWGLMRSATVIAAYLIKKYNISKLDAINIIKEQRPMSLSSIYNFNEILDFVENKYVNKINII
jgi:protein tyrosine/serine phosphatase